MAKISEVEIPALLFDEQGAAPATPGSGMWKIYFKADGLYIVDDNGTELGPLGTGGGGGGGSGVGARASLAATQSIPGDTGAVVEWDTEDYDDGGLIDVEGANPSRFTVPGGEGGVYLVTACLLFSAAGSSDVKQCQIWVDGEEYSVAQTRSSGSGAQAVAAADTVKLDAGQYVEIFVRQTNASANVGHNGASLNYASVVKLY